MAKEMLFSRGSICYSLQDVRFFLCGSDNGTRWKAVALIYAQITRYLENKISIRKYLYKHRARQLQLTGVGLDTCNINHSLIPRRDDR